MEPQGLYEKVILRIEAEKQRQIARKQLGVVLMVFLSLSVAAIPVWNAFWASIGQSGFGQYLSLIFSDSRVVISHWQDFGLSLLESLPVVNVAGFLAILLTFLLTLKFMFKYSKTVFTKLSRIN
jgi:hypothetical protein